MSSTLIYPVVMVFATVGHPSVASKFMTFAVVIFIASPFLFPPSIFLWLDGLWLSRRLFRRCFGLERLVGILGSQFWWLFEGADGLRVDKTFSCGVGAPFQADPQGSNRAGELPKVSSDRLDAT